MGYVPSSHSSSSALTPSQNHTSCLEKSRDDTSSSVCSSRSFRSSLQLRCWILHRSWAGRGPGMVLSGLARGTWLLAAHCRNSVTHFFHVKADCLSCSQCPARRNFTTRLLLVPVLLAARNRKNEHPFFCLMGKRKCDTLVLCSVPQCISCSKAEG